MKVSDAIFSIEKYDENSVICARRPFSPSSDAVIAQFAEDFSIPTAIQKSGYAYFLERDGVLDLLDMISIKNVAPDKKAEFVCYYANYDAYPNWYYALPDR